MAIVPTAVNDPIFNFHHCNIDQIFESWIQWFAVGNSNPALLPAYVPASGGHPGHNCDDYMVPFFPIVIAGGQYRAAEEWGYQYDEFVPVNISDDTIPDCSIVVSNDTCPTCDANNTCIDCMNINQTCRSPVTTIDDVVVDTVLVPPLPLGLGLGLGLGIPLLVSVAAIILLIIGICCRKKSKPLSSAEGMEMTTVKT